MRIKTRTITTNYELSGPPQAPVVMFSHSLGCNLRLWQPQTAALEGRFRLLRYDTRGHGGSDAPAGPYRLEELVSDVVALLDALELGVVHFVGISMGGMIGQGLALDHPDRLGHLVLCDTSARMPPEAQPIVQERIDIAQKQGLSSLVEATLGRWFTAGFLKRGGAAVETVRGMVLGTRVEGYIGCTEAIRRLNYLDDLHRIRKPTLVVVGEEDPGTPVAASQAIHERIAGSRLVILPSASHLCNVEQAKVFNATLLDFLPAAG